MPRTADITLTDTAWSGWVPGGSSKETSVRLTVTEGQCLSPETLGHSLASFGGSESMFYTLTVERIVEYRVVLAFRRLVIRNPDRTINLTAQPLGSFTLELGRKAELATPTMDAGTCVTVTLHSISNTNPGPQEGK